MGDGVDYKPYKPSYQCSVDPDELQVLSNFQFQLFTEFFSLPVPNSGTDEVPELMGVFKNVFISCYPNPMINFVLQAFVGF